MLRFVLLFLFVFSLFPQEGSAQQEDDLAWVQIEARPTLQTALTRAEGFARALPDVNGFALAGGWYAIALGPYSRNDAEEVLRSYRAQGLIPRDSYIAFSDIYFQQYWPPGQNAVDPQGLNAQGLNNQGLNSEGLSALDSSAEDASPVLPREVEQTPDSTLSQTLDDPETPAQARRSESRLTGQERRDLQTALKWAGFYNAAIDGAFGRGTRTSMRAWQNANGFDATGILTSVQRDVLLGQYNAILDGLDMQLVRDLEAGIEVKLPTASVGFTRYDPPFAQYDPNNGGDMRVLLISQRGDRQTLTSLYDIMQTLTIVPLEGPRRLSRDSFSLVGRNASFVSQTEVSLSDGEIKGFTLIWPSGDEARRTRVLDEMRASFTRRTGVINPGAGAGTNEQIDLISGLEVRQPRLSRSGFFVDTSGAVVTSAEAVQSCARITLDDEYDATLTGIDVDGGIALLKPTQRLAPPAIARFSPLPPRLQSEVAVAGYSFEGQLDAPSVTFGTLSDLKGLRGEANVSRLSMDALPGDVGGPVFDSSGNVFAMLLPLPGGSRQLPQEVRFALTTDAITSMIERAGLRINKGDVTAQLDPVDITGRGVGMTVLVRCWE